MVSTMPIIPGLIAIAVFLIYAKRRNNRAKSKLQNLGNSILGVIGCAKDVWRYYALFFTVEGIIVALTWDKLSQLDTLDTTNGELESVPIAAQLATKSLDDILHADKSNFAIPYDTIRSIHVKKGKLVRDSRITIITDQKNYEYSFQEPSFKEVIDIVKKAVPNKLSTE
jgi:hypothetical protein